MRFVLKTLGWLFALTAVFRSGLVIYTVSLAARLDSVPWNISVEILVTEYVTFLDWAPELGRALFPEHFIEGILDKPALIMISLGAIGAALLAYICFKLSRH